MRGLVNTLIYAVVTSGAKTMLELLLAVLLISGIFAQGFLRPVIFFPVLRWSCDPPSIRHRTCLV